MLSREYPEFWGFVTQNETLYFFIYFAYTEHIQKLLEIVSFKVLNTQNPRIFLPCIRKLCATAKPARVPCRQASPYPVSRVSSIAYKLLSCKTRIAVGERSLKVSTEGDE